MARSRAALARPRAWAAVLLLCFLVSGVGSLVLEVVWTRMLQLVFGSTTLAVSTILVSYMLGLGLGGLLAGRLAGRLANPVRTYGWLELVAAASAVGVTWAVQALPSATAGAFGPMSFWSLSLLRFTLSLALMIVPTMAMGATLPVLVAAVVRDERVGRDTGLLYGLNTLGAVAGVLLATFAFLPTFGVFKTALAGATLDGAVGLVALLWLAPSGPRRPPRAAPTAALAPAPGRRWGLPLLAYAAVGFSALVYEVSWTRTLAMVLGSSTHAFAAMLAAFLIGIALGSLAARRWIDRVARPTRAFAAVIAFLAIVALSTSFAIPLLPDAFLWAWHASGGTTRALPMIHVVISILVMLPPTLLLGALFPLLVRMLAQERGGAVRATGDAYFANTLGSAFGAFCAGFLLIPWLGLQGTVVLVACINLVTAALLVSTARDLTPISRAAGAAGLAALTVVLVWAPLEQQTEPLTRGVFYEPILPRHREIELLPLHGIERAEQLFYRDGVSATVSVHRDRGQLYLRINGKTDATSLTDMPTQVLLGHLAFLFGAQPRDVLVVGFASGVTVGSIALHPVARIDTVEIEPVVIEASRFFDAYNHRPLEDPRVRSLIDDGRSFLVQSEASYDLIVSAPSNPWLSGASSLFTREYFASAKRALRPGGRLVQWVQLYGMDQDGVRSILAAVRSAFPYVYGFAHQRGSGDLMVMATDEALSYDDLPRWESLAPRVHDDLRRVSNYTTTDLWSLLRLAPDHIDELVGADPIVNDDDNLFVELRGPRTLYRDTNAANWRAFDRFPAGSLAVAELAGPLDAESIGALALAYLVSRGDTRTAIELHNLAQQRGPSAHNKALRAYAARHIERAPLEKQRRLLNEAVAENPGSPMIRLLRADLEVATGEADAALLDLGVVLEQIPGDPEAVLLRAIALGQLDRHDEAAEAVDELLRGPLELERPGTLSQAARIYEAAGRLEDARRAQRQLLEFEPNAAADWSRLARIHEAMGRAEDAGRALENAENARRNQALLRHRDALTALDRGDTEKAMDLLRDAIEIDPDYTAPNELLERLGAR